MNDCVAPLASVVPAGEAGLETADAVAVPVTATKGAGSGASTIPAPPLFVACSVSWSCCSPAESVERLSEAESESCAGCCTVTGLAAAGPGASAVALFASTPLAEASYCQVYVADAPPASSVPAVEGGAEATVATALPVAERVGAGSASRRTAAPPALLSESASETRCSPAETFAGVAEAVSESIAGAGPSTRRPADASTVPERGPRLQRTEIASAAFTAAAGFIEVSSPNTLTGA